MDTLTYKDYTARVEFSDEDGCFVGHIAGIRDIVGFHGESVEKLWAAFEEAVDEYEDILVTRKRIQEIERDPAVMRPISELRASLEADGLLDG